MKTVRYHLIPVNENKQCWGNVEGKVPSSTVGRHVIWFSISENSIETSKKIKKLSLQNFINSISRYLSPRATKHYFKNMFAFLYLLQCYSQWPRHGNNTCGLEQMSK